MGIVVPFQAKQARPTHATVIGRALTTDDDIKAERAWMFYVGAQRAWSNTPTPHTFTNMVMAASAFFTAYLKSDSEARTAAMLEFLDSALTDARRRQVEITYRSFV